MRGMRCSGPKLPACARAERVCLALCSEAPPPPLPICRLDQAAESKLSLLRMNAFAVDLL